MPIPRVRVRDAVTGHHVTITEALQKLDPQRFSVLKQDAVDYDGRPLAPKHKSILAAGESTEAEASKAKEATK